MCVSTQFRKHHFSLHYMRMHLISVAVSFCEKDFMVLLALGLESKEDPHVVVSLVLSFLKSELKIELKSSE